MEVNPSDGYAYQWPCLYGGEYEIIGTEGFYGDLETDIANAKLIAQAPVLAERLAALIDVMVGEGYAELDSIKSSISTLQDAGYYD
jgi:hypothetical protein